MKYKAFISYCREDEKWARWLHSSLENYRTPRKSGNRASLKPIFLDREELTSSSNLTQTMTDVLESSEFLIVLCSAYTPSSVWVNKETSYFKDLGRADRIFCVFIDGLSTDCLPRCLNDEYSPEPLAIDLRDDGKRRARTKLAAALLGLDFELLRRREYGRRYKRWLAVSIASMVGMVAAGTLAWTAIDSANEAKAQRLNADQEAMNAMAISAFLAETLATLDPYASVADSRLTVEKTLQSALESLDGKLPEPSDTKVNVWLTLAKIYRRIGNARAASELAQQCVNWYEQKPADSPEPYLDSLSVVAASEGDLGKLQAAKDIWNAVAEQSRGLIGIESVYYTTAIDNIGIIYGRLGEPEAALVALEESLLLKQKFMSSDHTSISDSLMNIGISLSLLGRLEEANLRMRQALEMEISRLGSNHPRVVRANANLAQNVLKQGQPLEAWEYISVSLEGAEATLGTDHPHYAALLETAASIRLAQDDVEDAIRYLERAIQISSSTLGINHIDTANAQVELSLALIRIGETEEAMARTLQAIGHLESVYGVGSGNLANAYGVLIVSMLSSNEIGQLEKYTSAFEQSITSGALMNEHLKKLLLEALEGTDTELIDARRPVLWPGT